MRIFERIRFFFQFQERGTPHVHGLATVRNDGIQPEDITSNEECKRQRVKQLVKDVVTCKLKHPTHLPTSAD